MTTIERLNIMAMAKVFAYCKDDLLQAASKLEALQKEVEDVRGDLAVVTTEFCEFRKHSWEQQETLRAQNRELREALQLIHSRTFGGASLKYSHERIAEVCAKALSQPEAGKI